MPAATAPLGAPAAPAKPGATTSKAPAATKPGAATKPTATTKPTGTAGKKGFTKPAGFSKQAPPVDDAEEQKPNLVVLVVSIIGLLLALGFCWIEYETDQTPDRITNSERIFGDPAATGGGEAADSGESDGGSDEGAAEEESKEE